MPPDEPTEEERLEQLPQDGQTPFSPADDEADETVDDEVQVNTKTLDDTHPITDTDIQEEGIYQDSLADETNAHEPNEGNQVVGYDPEADEDPKQGVS